MPDLVKVHTIAGWEADMYRIFLESQGFEVLIAQEAAGQLYGLSLSTLGEADIYARAEDAEAVQEIIRKLENGEYELNPAEQPGDQPDEEFETGGEEPQ